MKSLQVGDVTWFIFNIYGLKIKHSSKWREFLFDDATIANPDEVKNYLINEHNVDKMSASSLYQVDSYLIVHIGGKIEENEDRFKLMARRRADEIISLVYFVFFYLTDYNIGITLDYEVHNMSGGVNQYFSSNTTQSITSDNTKGEHCVYLPKKPFILSRMALNSLLQRELFRKLTNMIVSKRTKFHKLICNSLISYYRTSNIPSPTAQFIGAITSMEILLKNNMQYDNIKNRIYVLLNSKFYQDFIENSGNNIGVFDLRHKIIHEGNFCDSNDAWRAIRLSSCCILAFTNTCEYFSSKDELCNCFDLLYYYLKDESARQNDYFGIKNNWEKIAFNQEKLDWIILRTIFHFSINLTEIVDPSKLKTALTIYTYHKFRNIDIKSAYHLMNNFIIYDSLKFKSFPIFNTFLETNIEAIEKEFDVYNKYHKLEGTGY